MPEEQKKQTNKQRITVSENKKFNATHRNFLVLGSMSHLHSFSFQKLQHNRYIIHLVHIFYDKQQQQQYQSVQLLIGSHRILDYISIYKCRLLVKACTSPLVPETTEAFHLRRIYCSAYDVHASSKESEAQP